MNRLLLYPHRCQTADNRRSCRHIRAICCCLRTAQAASSRLVGPGGRSKPSFSGLILRWIQTTSYVCPGVPGPSPPLHHRARASRSGLEGSGCIRRGRHHGERGTTPSAATLQPPGRRLFGLHRGGQPARRWAFGLPCGGTCNSNTNLWRHKTHNLPSP